MKYLDGNYYVEVKDHRFENNPTENINYYNMMGTVCKHLNEISQR